MIKEGFRALRLIVGLAFRVDPLRSIGLVVVNFVVAASALTAVALGVAVNGVAAGDRGQALLGALAITLLTGALNFGVTQDLRMGLAVSEKASLEIDREVMRLTDDIPTLEPFEVPEFQNRLELVQGASGAVTSSIRTLTRGLLMAVRLIVVIFVLVRLHPLLILLPVFAVPTVWAAAVSSRLRHRADLATAERTRRAEHLFGLPTSVHSAKELRVFELQDEIVGRYRRDSEEIRAVRRGAEAKASILTAGALAIFGVAFVAGIAVVARAVVRGERPPGDVAVVLLVGGQLTGYVSDTASAFGAFGGQIRTMGHYMWLIDYAKRQAGSGPQDASVPSRLTEGIRFESVSFRYPGTDTEVLTEIDLHLPAGTTVAMVGDNGAGKTTLVKLLCGFYEPTEGRILVDGVPLSRFRPAEWRRRLSGAFQDYAKFEFRAREVVGVGDIPRMDDPQAVSLALTRAGASDVPERLEEGLETQLGREFGGQDLSAGQWQKLALARAMMRVAPLVLVLDEPTASLDAETEHALFEQYAGAAREAARQAGAITVLVSHRFTTVRMADLIVVVDGGRVVEKGTHEELMSRGGSYADLFSIQARGYA